jgi:protein-histidine pros-kinase
MKLLTKFNLILVLLFGAGGLLILHLARNFLMNNAQRQVLQEAELMMAGARSIRDYTSSELAPLLEQNPQHRIRFLAQTVPAYGATVSFNRLRESYPDYSYKEAALNPTNLQNRAVDWEADIIRYLRDHANEKSVTGERETPIGRSLYVAKPIAADPPCLECHSTPDRAPRAMIHTYGTANGFGWKPDEIVAAQIVSVPMSVPVRIANEAFHRLALFLAITLLITILALDAGLYFIVIRPLKMVSATADRISKGETGLPELSVKGRDEIALVTASFNRMHVSLVKALRMLEH